MSKTLIEIVKSILSSMDGDEVVSINETVESLQIANIVRDSFEHLQASMDLPSENSFFSLTGLSDPALPVVMTKPAGVISLDWVKYDNQVTGDTLVNFIPVSYLPFVDFMARQHMITSGTNTQAIEYLVNTDTLRFTVYSDRFPTFYTTFNDDTILFDSYNSAEESYSTKARTLCFGLKEQTFTLTDSFVIPLDTRQTNLLLNEAKAQAFIDLKQVANPNAEKRARRGWVTSQKTKNEITKGNPLDHLPNYGRK